MSSGGGGTWKKQQDGNEIDIERSSGRGAKWAKSKCRPAKKKCEDDDNVVYYFEESTTTAKKSDGDEANDADNGRDM